MIRRIGLLLLVSFVTTQGVPLYCPMQRDHHVAAAEHMSAHAGHHAPAEHNEPAPGHADPGCRLAMVCSSLALHPAADQEEVHVRLIRGSTAVPAMLYRSPSYPFDPPPPRRTA